MVEALIRLLKFNFHPVDQIDRQLQSCCEFILIVLAHGLHSRLSYQPAFELNPVVSTTFLLDFLNTSHKIFHPEVRPLRYVDVRNVVITRQDEGALALFHEIHGEELVALVKYIVVILKDVWLQQWTDPRNE